MEPEVVNGPPANCAQAADTSEGKRGQDGGEKEEISNMFMSTRVQSVVLFGYNIIKEEQPL